MAYERSVKTRFLVIKKQQKTVQDLFYGANIFPSPLCEYDTVYVSIMHTLRVSLTPNHRHHHHSCFLCLDVIRVTYDRAAENIPHQFPRRTTQY